MEIGIYIYIYSPPTLVLLRFLQIAASSAILLVKYVTSVLRLTHTLKLHLYGIFLFSFLRRSNLYSPRYSNSLILWRWLSRRGVSLNVDSADGESHYTSTQCAEDELSQHRHTRDSIARIFVSGFFVKHLLLVPLDILRNIFDFNTVIEELFDFKGDFQIKSRSYSTLKVIPRWIHNRGVSTPRCINLRGVLTPLCIHHRGVTNSTPLCIQVKSSTPWCIHYRSRNSPMYSLPGSEDSLVYSLQGSRDSPVYST